jgi:hypothetical protein
MLQLLIFHHVLSPARCSVAHSAADDNADGAANYNAHHGRELESRTHHCDRWSAPFTGLKLEDGAIRNQFTDLGNYCSTLNVSRCRPSCLPPPQHSHRHRSAQNRSQWNPLFTRSRSGHSPGGRSTEGLVMRWKSSSIDLGLVMHVLTAANHGAHGTANHPANPSAHATPHQGRY